MKNAGMASLTISGCNGANDWSDRWRASSRMAWAVKDIMIVADQLAGNASSISRESSTMVSGWWPFSNSAYLKACAIDEEAAEQAVLLAGDPVSVMVAADEDDGGEGGSIRGRFNELHVSRPSEIATFIALR